MSFMHPRDDLWWQAYIAAATGRSTSGLVTAREHSIFCESFANESMARLDAFTKTREARDAEERAAHNERIRVENERRADEFRRKADAERERTKALRAWVIHTKLFNEVLGSSTAIPFDVVGETLVEDAQYGYFYWAIEVKSCDGSSQGGRNLRVHLRAFFPKDADVGSRVFFPALSKEDEDRPDVVGVLDDLWPPGIAPAIPTFF